MKVSILANLKVIGRYSPIIPVALLPTVAFDNLHLHFQGNVAELTGGWDDIYSHISVVRSHDNRLLRIDMLP